MDCGWNMVLKASRLVFRCTVYTVCDPPGIYNTASAKDGLLSAETQFLKGTNVQYLEQTVFSSFNSYNKPENRFTVGDRTNY